MNSGIVIPLHQLNYNLSEVTVTAYNNPEKLISVAGAVSTVPVDSLQFAGYNIVSSLSVSPGLIIQEATMGTMKLTLRGIGSRYPYGTKKIKMFFDGIPLYSAEGETYFDDISPEYLSRIEILRGPASSIYGASLGGTVDFVSAEACIWSIGIESYEFCRFLWLSEEFPDLFKQRKERRPFDIIIRNKI